MCTRRSHHVQRPIAAGRPGKIKLQELPEEIDFVQRNLNPNKHHNTAGFYAMLVQIAVQEILQNAEKAEREQREDDFIKRFEWDEDVGGYHDVGQHTNVVPQATSWSLVEQVLHCLADQVCLATRS
jgi:hypothetical protein